MEESDPENVTLITADASKHYDLIYKMFVEKFSQSAPMPVALGATPEDMDKFFKQIVDNTLTQNNSILAYIGEKCVGFALNFIETEPKKSNINPEEDFDGDLTEEIAKNHWGNFPANAIAAMMSESSKNFEYYIPDSKKFFKLRILYVDPEQTGKGIGTKLVAKCIVIAKMNECDHLITIAAAAASAHGFKVVREIPVSAYKQNEKQIFSNLPDGCKNVKLMILKI
uniref:N-acetyltransferase domain-containing protein n=1 Tax=Panagrolaimus davidi TaxID=227884 RepID=A0A914Q0T8_9BILA